MQLSGSVPPYGVYVAVLDKRDPNGQGQEAPVWDSLQAKADGFYSPVYNTSQAFYWNGDDAVALIKGTLTSNPDQNVATIPGAQIIDIFGKIGEQPTNASGTTSPAGGWSTGFPYTGTNGVIVTQDHSLIRKPGVKKGVTNPQISFFDPLAEYDSIPPVKPRLDQNGDTIYNQQGNMVVDGNWGSLGTHNCACNPLAVPESAANQLIFYPNPSNGQFFVTGAENVAELVVRNALGQRMLRVLEVKNGSMQFQLNDRGVYVVELTLINGTRSTKKLIVK